MKIKNNMNYEIKELPVGHPVEKLKTLEELKELRATLANHIVILTTGSYNIPQHLEHYRYWLNAKMLGMLEGVVKEIVLIVAMDSDSYILKRKKNAKLVTDFKVRALTAAYQPSVDYIFEHEGDDLEMIKALSPDIYVQSLATKEESPDSKQPIFEEVEKRGGKNVVFIADNEYGVSTSKLVKKIKES